MTNSAWFANSAALTVTTGATTTTLAALKNVSFNPHFDVTELYAVGGIHRVALSRSNYYVDFKCAYAMWDSSAESLLSSYLAGGYLGTPDANSVATDENLSGQREKVATMDITITVNDSSSAKKMTATIYSCYFNDIPFEADEGQFISRNLTGKGESMSFHYSALTCT